MGMTAGGPLGGRSKGTPPVDRETGKFKSVSGKQTLISKD